MQLEMGTPFNVDNLRWPYTSEDERILKNLIFFSLLCWWFVKTSLVLIILFLSEINVAIKLMLNKTTHGERKGSFVNVPFRH